MQQNFERSLRKIIIKRRKYNGKLKKLYGKNFFDEMRPANFFDESGNELTLGWEDYSEYEIIEVTNIDDLAVTEKNIIVRHI